MGLSFVLWLLVTATRLLDGTERSLLICLEGPSKSTLLIGFKDPSRDTLLTCVGGASARSMLICFWGVERESSCIPCNGLVDRTKPPGPEPYSLAFSSASNGFSRFHVASRSSSGKDLPELPLSTVRSDMCLFSSFRCFLDLSTYIGLKAYPLCWAPAGEDPLDLEPLDSREVCVCSSTISTFLELGSVLSIIGERR